MSFDKLSGFFAYIFYNFTRIFKRNRKPEYSKVVEEDDELEYVRLNDCDTPHTFVMVRD